MNYCYGTIWKSRQRLRKLKPILHAFFWTSSYTNFHIGDEGAFEQKLNDAVVTQTVHSAQDINQFYVAIVHNYDKQLLILPPGSEKRLVF